MWGKPLTIKRGNVANTIAKGAQRIADTATMFDNSVKTVKVRLEEICADIINSDPDVQLVTHRTASKYGIEGELFICPKFNEDTLMIEGYGILWLVDKKSVPIHMCDSATAAVDYLTDVCISRDEGFIKNFLSKFIA